MIEVILRLVGHEIDEATRALEEILSERREIAEERQYWQQQKDMPHDLHDGYDIQSWLSYAARADREMKRLAEKDFLVEERINECRTVLLGLSQRKKTLETVLIRRQLAAEKTAQRRMAREYSQRVMARAAKEANREPWD